MGHSTVRAAILPDILTQLMDFYGWDENTTLDRFYRSATGAAFSDDETGLYGQSPNYIVFLFREERGDI